MDETLSNWRTNKPQRPARTDAWPPIVTGSILACLILLALAILSGRRVNGQEFTAPRLVAPLTPFRQPVSRPAGEWILFGTPTCSACQVASADLASFGIPFRKIVLSGPDPAEWTEFLAAVPETSLPLRPGSVGPLQSRPASTPVPVLWYRGSATYWVGWDQAQARDALRWMQSQTRSVDRMAEPLAAPPPYGGDLAGAGIDGQLLGFDADYPEDFDGVVMIVQVAQLTEGNEDLRIAAANRAASTLTELAQTEIGRRVRVDLVAEIAEPDTFAKLAALTGSAPGQAGRLPVAVHVLIPRRFEGMQGFLAGRVERALQSHYQDAIQSAGVHLVFERIHTDTFNALLSIVDDPTRDSRRRSAPPFDPVSFLAAAWASRHSGLGRRILARFGYA